MSGTGFAYIEQKGSAVTIPVTVEKMGFRENHSLLSTLDPVKKVIPNVNNVNQGKSVFRFESFKELSADM